MLTDSWLLRKNDPALPRIIAAVRESVLPKLREENERTKTKSKGKKKGAIKDLIAQGNDLIREHAHIANLHRRFPGVNISQRPILAPLATREKEGLH